MDENIHSLKTGGIKPHENLLSFGFPIHSETLKTDLLLLHGALGSTAQLQGLATRLSGHVEVHCIGLSGHGGVPFQERFEIDQFADEVISYMADFPERRFHVFGYSMGGYVALYLERRAPATFQSIVTLATKFDWNPESAQKEAAMLNPDKILEKIPAFAGELKERHGESGWRMLLEKTATMMLSMGHQPPLSPSDFAEIKIPVVLCHGTLDKMVSEEETMAIAKSLPTGNFVSYPDWPHPLEKCDPDKLSGDIIGYLS
ncbi:MAG: alpha/beta fold hydrolase [Cryomorphaceae bacterium]|nr:MAG: alpha/beta fold hydrolase [Cryomorphaceae bacterium]